MSPEVYEQVTRSAELFASEVMPVLRRPASVTRIACPAGKWKLLPDEPILMVMSILIRSGLASEAEAVLELWRSACAEPTITDSVASIVGLVRHNDQALIVAEAGPRSGIARRSCAWYPGNPRHHSPGTGGHRADSTSPGPAAALLVVPVLTSEQISLRLGEKFK